jgi:hypothetical protein
METRVGSILKNDAMVACNFCMSAFGSVSNNVNCTVNGEKGVVVDVVIRNEVVPDLVVEDVGFHLTLVLVLLVIIILVVDNSGDVVDVLFSAVDDSAFALEVVLLLLLSDIDVAVVVELIVVDDSAFALEVVLLLLLSDMGVVEVGLFVSNVGLLDVTSTEEKPVDDGEGRSMQSMTSLDPLMDTVPRGQGCKLFE